MAVDWRDSVSGVAGSLCAVSAGMPFDVVKIRLQTQGGGGDRAGGATGRAAPARYRSPLHCAGHMVRHEGVRSLYKGMLPAMASQVCENFALFTANGVLRRLWLSSTGAEPSLPAHALLGGASGIFSVIAMCPAEVVKCRLQVLRADGAAGPAARHTPSAVLADVLRTDGAAGLFRGITALWARDVPFNTIFLGSYEAYSHAWVNWLGLASKDELHPALVTFNGGLAGATGWSVVFPFDVVKSRMQTKAASGVLACVADVFRVHGLRGFYNGWSAAVLRAFPANGALFLAYEASQRVLARV